MAFKVTPWEVSGKVDYERLAREFGVKPITDDLKKEITGLAGEDHHYLRRGIFFAHMYLDRIIKNLKDKKPTYLYTGRAPSGPMHIGHAVPLLFTKWLQERLGLNLIIQIPDEEKVLFKGLSFKESREWVADNITDIIALGFDMKKTRILIDTRDAGEMYELACEVARRTTASTAKALFGLKNEDNVGKYFYTCMQSVPCFLPSIKEGEPTNVLIPCAIDQDVHFRLTRDVAEKIGYPKPATILSRFLPALSQSDKMSSSGDKSIWLSDSPETVKKKINKYAFSGGRESIEEHRRLGGVPEVDVAYQYLTYFEEDDTKLKKIYDDYKTGRLLSGEIKGMAINKINNFLRKHQAKKEGVKKEAERLII